METSRHVIEGHTVVASLIYATDLTKPATFYRRRQEGDDHGERDSFRQTRGTTCICQRQRRINTNALAQVITGPHGLHAEDLPAHLSELADAVTTSFEVAAHGIETAKQISITVGQDQLDLCDPDGVDQGFGGEVGVHQRGGSADGQEAIPSADHVWGVDHQKGDEFPGLDALGEEPLCILVDAGVSLVVTEALAVGPEGF